MVSTGGGVRPVGDAGTCCKVGEEINIPEEVSVAAGKSVLVKTVRGVVVGRAVPVGNVMGPDVGGKN
jgi:hypothetical protein